VATFPSLAVICTVIAWNFAGDGIRDGLSSPMRRASEMPWIRGMAQIGIRVNIVTLDFPTLIERLTHSFDYEACILGLVNVDLDPNGQMNVWLSSSDNHQWNPAQKTPATPWEAEIDKLMREQAAWVSQDVRPDPIFKIAAQVGMTRAQFDSCRENRGMIAQLSGIKERGRTLGIIGTPNFFVQGKLVKSVIGIKEIREMVDPILAGRIAASDATTKAR